VGGSDETGDERRDGDRIPINEEFSRDASTWVSDLSRGGVFVHSAELLPVGSLIDLRFTVLVEDLTVIEAVAKVVRHSRHPQGMGVEFVSLSPQTAAHIEALLATRRPLDSGAPLRLPVLHQPELRRATPDRVEDDPTRRITFARPAPVGSDDDATASFPRVPLEREPAEATTVFRPPPSVSGMPGPAEDERTRQFPVMKRGQPKPK
jgi:hypothetical protein